MVMKKAGLIGGIGPAATLDYYSGIIDGYRSGTGAENYPEIIIYSIDMSEMLSYVADGRWEKVIDQLSEAIKKLAAAGADFIAVASNTPHIVFNELAEKSPLQLISIVEETCGYTEAMGYGKVLTIGTLFTMRSGLYSEPLRRRGIFSILPSESEQSEIYSLFFPNLENGIVIKEDKLKMITLLNRIIAERNADAVLLGCTELPLMIKPGDLIAPVINTTQVHIDSIVGRMTAVA